MSLTKIAEYDLAEIFREPRAHFSATFPYGRIFNFLLLFAPLPVL